MDIDWDYMRCQVHVSMLQYVPKALIHFQHKAPQMPQHQSYLHIKSTYCETRQYAEASKTSEPTSKEYKNYIQEVISTLLYYAQCINSSMLKALGSLATQQANPTQKHFERGQATIRLCTNTPRRNCNLQCRQHGPHSSQ